MSVLIEPTIKPVEKMTPEEELESLEQECITRGISSVGLVPYRQWGSCPDPIQMRIAVLRQWRTKWKTQKTQ